jgi:hypothetical protein
VIQIVKLPVAIRYTQGETYFPQNVGATNAKFEQRVDDQSARLNQLMGEGYIVLSDNTMTTSDGVFVVMVLWKPDEPAAPAPASTTIVSE